MRDHYVGDVTDFIKFSLLRALVNPTRRLGVAWYYIEGCDNEKDGTHTEWTGDISWQKFDPKIHSWLTDKLGKTRSVTQLEDRSFWKYADFHNQPVSENDKRGEWASQMCSQFESMDLVFLDPDNGIKNGSRKHATMEEIGKLKRKNRTIICIVFPHRNTKHANQIELLTNDLKTVSASGRVAILKTSVSVPSKKNPKYITPRQRWFAVIDPSDADINTIEEFVNGLNNLHRVTAKLEKSWTS